MVNTVNNQHSTAKSLANYEYILHIEHNIFNTPQKSYFNYEKEKQRTKVRSKSWVSVIRTLPKAVFSL